MSESNGNNLLAKKDWTGILTEILVLFITFGLTAWSLWSVMYGNTDPYFAALSTMTIPSVYIAVEKITGRNIKNMNLTNNAKIDELTKASAEKISSLTESYETKLLNTSTIIQSKAMENYDLKEKVARLEEKNFALEARYRDNNISIDAQTVPVHSNITTVESPKTIVASPEVTVTAIPIIEVKKLP